MMGTLNLAIINYGLSTIDYRLFPKPNYPFICYLLVFCLTFVRFNQAIDEIGFPLRREI